MNTGDYCNDASHPSLPAVLRLSQCHPAALEALAEKAAASPSTAELRHELRSRIALMNAWGPVKRTQTGPNGQTQYVQLSKPEMAAARDEAKRLLQLLEEGASRPPGVPCRLVCPFVG